MQTRTIKFRAWDNGKMLGPVGILLTGTPGWLSKLSSEADIMQYTGLKDKNGVEIYEGDIIQSVSEMVRLDTNDQTGKIKTENYKVRWEPEKARWGRWKDNKFELLSGLNKKYLLEWYSVIGTIYEHSELVDKESM